MLSKTRRSGAVKLLEQSLGIRFPETSSHDKSKRVSYQTELDYLEEQRKEKERLDALHEQEYRDAQKQAAEESHGRGTDEASGSMTDEEISKHLAEHGWELVDGEYRPIAEKE